MMIHTHSSFKDSASTRRRSFAIRTAGESLRRCASRGRVALVLLWSLGLIAVSAGCEKKYDQSSAEGTFYSMIGMVQDGNVHQIPQLIRAEDPKMQETIARVGSLLGRLYRLQQTIEKEYPEELKRFMEETEKRYADQAVERAEQAGRNRGRSGWGESMRRVMADPFGTWNEELARLNVTYVSDDLYAVTRDGAPLFGVGVTIMRAEDDQWYFAWPDTIPGLDMGMPKSDAEWQVVNNMLASINNGLVFAEKRIDSGDFRSLEEIWEQIGREVMFQVGGQAVLYGRLIEMREETEKKDEASGGGEVDTPANADPGAASSEDAPATGPENAVVGRSG